MVNINMFFHAYYAINFMVCNQSFPTLVCMAKVSRINMTNYTSHDLVMI